MSLGGGSAAIGGCWRRWPRRFAPRTTSTYSTTTSPSPASLISERSRWHAQTVIKIMNRLVRAEEWAIEWFNARIIVAGLGLSWREYESQAHRACCDCSKRRGKYDGGTAGRARAQA